MADNTVTPGGLANSNVSGRQKKTLMFAVVAIVVILAGTSIYMNKPKSTGDSIEGGAKERMTGAAARTPGDSESFRMMNDEVQAVQRSLADSKKREQENMAKMNEILAIVQGEANADENLYEEIGLLTNQVRDLQQRLKEQESRPSFPRDATPLGGSPVREQGGGVNTIPPGPNGFGAQARQAAVPLPPQRRSQQVIVLKSAAGSKAVTQFDKNINGDLSKAKAPSVFETSDYVPPNAYAPGKVYVGVDAATGKAAQSDPQAAAFMIMGPARHVVIDGEIQETDLTGCIVNGAARGDLSTERVFIKLQKMTCPLPNGRVSVQEVEGHVTQLGKAGVRGTIVSRVGDQLNKAAIAGALSGIGQALGGAARGGVGVGSGGGLIQEIPDAESLAIAAGGSGVSGAADTLAQYYIEQAKAIQPVVAMPTGVDVELVFISGFKARPTAEEG